MHPVEGGTQKVTFNNEIDREYESQLRSARAQADGNPYVGGVGMDVKSTRNPHLRQSNVMPEQLIEGSASNFAQGDDAGNSPGFDDHEPDWKYGRQRLPQLIVLRKILRSFQADALEERLEMMRRGGQKRGYNDHLYYGA